ncbi:MAG: hypothetical protein C0408_01270 [Odoribacter sp.]|nr:hypothetical protein [Odoribacter sp.]
MRKAPLYIIAILLTQTLAGQDISVKTDYPAVIKAGEQFTIMWTINSGGGEFSGPSFEGFYKLMGPQTSYSSNTQIINGKMSQQTSYSYVYYLQAMNPGKFVIPPATFRYKNKDYKSDSLYIEVLKDGVARQAKSNNPVGNDGTEEVQGNGSELFIKLNLSRKEVYLGEHIIASVKLYTRVDLAGLNEVKFPAFNGFLKENLQTPQLTALQRENVNGGIYGTGLVQQFLLYPQITGEITIDPVEITVLLQQKSGQTDPIFGDFFTSYQTIPKAIASQPVRITVKPLPGNKPDDFSGIVGNIEINSSVNKDTVNVNDALNFKITIKGTGNLKLAASPVLKLSPDVEVYDPKISDNITNTSGGSTGQRTFEYLLIPRHYGDFIIPSISYTYFNPAKKQYEKLNTKEFRFYVRKGADQGTPVTVYGGVSKEDVKYVGKDIRFIKTGVKDLKESDQILISKRSFRTFYGFALILFFGVLFIRREQVRRNADLSIVRNRKAAKIASKRLKKASAFLHSGTNDRFYEEILKALWGYLSDKLSIPVSELTRNFAIELLKVKGIDDEPVNNLSVILDRCESARFSPSSSGTEASEIYEGALKFINTVENKIG